MFTTAKMRADQATAIHAAIMQLLHPLRDIIVDYTVDPRFEDAFMKTPRPTGLRTGKWESPSSNWMVQITSESTRYEPVWPVMYIHHCLSTSNQWRYIMILPLEPSHIWEFMCGTNEIDLARDSIRRAAQGGDDPKKIYENVRDMLKQGYARWVVINELVDVSAARARLRHAMRQT